MERQPLAERDRKCTPPYGGIPSETNLEQETVPKGREEGGHHPEDDHRGLHNHQDAVGHEGHKQARKRAAKQEHGKQLEREGLKHKTDREGTQKAREYPHPILVQQKEPRQPKKEVRKAGGDERKQAPRQQEAEEERPRKWEGQSQEQVYEEAKASGR